MGCFFYPTPNPRHYFEMLGVKPEKLMLMPYVAAETIIDKSNACMARWLQYIPLREYDTYCLQGFLGRRRKQPFPREPTDLLVDYRR